MLFHSLQLKSFTMKSDFLFGVGKCQVIYFYCFHVKLGSQDYFDNIAGLRHIRGILFDDSSEDHVEDQPEGDSLVVSSASGKSVEDSFPIDCVKCGVRKNSVRGLKMHILLAHLKSGKFKCTRCEVRDSFCRFRGRKSLYIFHRSHYHSN